MKYVVKIEIRIDMPSDLVLDDANASPAYDTRAKRQAVISADIKELIEDEISSEDFTFFDVQVTTVESDD